MFKLHQKHHNRHHNNNNDNSNNRSSSQDYKLDFKLSNFQAIQVPKGWDKLFVSLVSVETGKTVVKSGKASVRNGTCRWTETLSESVNISQENGASKELEFSFFKVVVAMGSSRSGILGEVTINLADYASSRTETPLSLQLKRCNYNTSLQFRIQCIAPKSKYREVQNEETDVHVEDEAQDYDDMDTKSDASDGAFSRSVGSTSSNHLEVASVSRGAYSREPSLSASESRNSTDSADTFSGKDIFSPQDDLIGGQDLIDSHNSGPSHSFHVRNDSRSTLSSFRSRGPDLVYLEHLKEETNANASVSSPVSHAGSSKYLLEAAEVMIEELRTEASIWERNAKKLQVDVDVLKKELEEQNKSQTTLSMELSASHQECNGLKQEIEHLKSLLETLTKKPEAKEELKLQASDVDGIQEELGKEIGFLEQSNANLTEQLQKTQESNIELLTILQELEGIIESQKSEIEHLSSQTVKVEEKEKVGVAVQELAFSCDLNVRDSKIGEAPQDIEREYPESIDHIKLELQLLQETQEELESTIQQLEKIVLQKDNEIEKEQELRVQAILDCETQWRVKLDTKEEEIMNLEKKLFEVVENRRDTELMVEIGNDTDLAKEAENLKRKVLELEKDLDELTDENFQLLLKLNDPSTDPCGNHDDNTSCACGTDISDLRAQLVKLKGRLVHREALIEDDAASSYSEAQQIDLERKCHDLETQLQVYIERIVDLEDQLQKFHVRAEEQQTEVSSSQQIQHYEPHEDTSEVHQMVPDTNFSSPSVENMSCILLETRKLLKYSLNLTKQHEHSFSSADPGDIQLLDDLDCEESLTWEEQLRVTQECLSKVNKFFEMECTRTSDLSHERKEDGTIRQHNQNLVHSSGCANGSSVGDPKDDDKVLVSSQTNELASKASEIEELKSDYLKKEEEVENLRKQLFVTEHQISGFRDETHSLKETVESLEKEKSALAECLEELKEEIIMLNSSVESHVSESKVLERLSSELGRGKEDLEQQLSDSEKENMQLSERISALEAQLRYLTNEKETCQLELRHSESQATNLRDEIKQLETELEMQKLDMKQKLQDLRNRWLEAQEECEYLTKANPKLQVTAENLMDECTSLQKLNGDLKRHNMELRSRCSDLETQLRDSQDGVSECLRRIGALEAEFSTVLEEVSLKEKSLTSELESLKFKDRELNEKLMQENISLNSMYSEKVIEVENTQKELAHLIDQISVAHDEQQTVTHDVMLELSVLRADKAKLEVSVQDLQRKFTASESKFSILEAESGTKMQELMTELKASRQNQEALLADNEKLLVSLECSKNNEEKNKHIIHGHEKNLKAFDYEKLQLSNETSSLKEQLQRANQFQEEVLALKSSLNDAKFELEKVRASLDLLSGDHEELKSEKVSLFQKVCGMEKAVLEFEECKRGKIALEEKIMRLEGDLAAREALCAQDAELKFELSRVKRANAELQRKIKHLDQDREDYLNKALSLEEQLKKNSRAILHQVNSVGNSSDADADAESLATVSSSGDEKQIFTVAEADNFNHSSKMQILENELAEALEANDMYKAQLKRFLSEEHDGSDAFKTPDKENLSDARRHVNGFSLLEVELRDLRERYLQMSLKYAEVEAQREELVLKLKSTNNRRRWFS